MSDNFEDSKGENPMDQSENPLDQSINPWQVDSVQAFLYLHCPECVFVTPLKEQGNFQDHAIENHPLSLQGVYGKLSVKKELNSEENLMSKQSQPDSKLETAQDESKEFVKPTGKCFVICT